MKLFLIISSFILYSFTLFILPESQDNYESFDIAEKAVNIEKATIGQNQIPDQINYTANNREDFNPEYDKENTENFNLTNENEDNYIPDNNPVTYDEDPENYPLETPDTYINVDDQVVQSPTHYNDIPPGACAKCRDESFSFSQHRKGTCSGHGGVAQWLK